MPDLWDFPGRSLMKLWDKNIKIPTTCIGLPASALHLPNFASPWLSDPGD